MSFDETKYKTDKSISNPIVRNQARRYSLRTQLAFLPDQVIGQSWFFRLLTIIYYYIYVYFHNFEIVGLEKLDPNKGYLIIARHSTHNGEILGTVVAFYHKTGKVLRSLIHRFLPPFFPFLRLMGCVPGEPESALSLLRSGFWVVVIPGGADEGMIGHENAYKVCWPKRRKGFARVATEAEVPIVPLFLANVDEMRWNPILFFWNLLGLGRLFTRLYDLNIPMLNSFLLLVSSTTWFLVTFIQIPIPAKLTLYIGDPIKYDMKKDSIDDVVERSRQALQSLIDRHQPHGKSYLNAVKQRFACVKKTWQKLLFEVKVIKPKQT